jgi:hypothetical protein
MARKPYNVPAAVTDSVRRREQEKRMREDSARSSDSEISASDKMALKKIIEEEKSEDMPEEEGFRKGGSVRKYAEGGLVRGSVRGGGVALRGIGKGKVC